MKIGEALMTNTTLTTLNLYSDDKDIKRTEEKKRKRSKIEMKQK